jgi:hypothetical protein
VGVLNEVFPHLGGTEGRVEGGDCRAAKKIGLFKVGTVA